MKYPTWFASRSSRISYCSHNFQTHHHQVMS